MESRDRVTARGETTSLADRKRRAGQRLIIGFRGPSVDDDLRALVREMRPAGFILFKRNVESPEQVAELNRELASLTEPNAPALLTVDQEGGRVQRIREPATVWPPMATVARADLVREVSTAIARELRALRFNLNFAPVADVNTNPKNPVIGDRAFGNRAEKVARSVRVFVEAHQSEGIIACAKHFPGHGDTSVDSHLALPVVERDEDELRHVDLVPFRAAVDSRVGSLMTSHVLYPAWDEEVPATLSTRIVPKILRKEWKYDGVVFSDDLEMKAVAGRYTVDDLVERATHASVDVLLCCEHAELQAQAFEALVRLQETDKAFDRASEASVRRVMSLRERFFRGERSKLSPGVVGCAEHRDLAARAADRGAL